MVRVKWLPICFLLGVVVSLSLVYFLTDGDSTIRKATERRDEIVEKNKQGKKTVAELIDKQEKENKKLVEEVKEKEKIVSKTKSEVAKKEKKIREKNEVTVDDLEELVKEKDKVIIRQENLIKSLYTRIDNLELDKKELKIQLEISYNVQDDAVRALNGNLLDMKGLTAKNKAMKIGLGIGLPLAIGGGIVGGFYIGGALK